MEGPTDDEDEESSETLLVGSLIGVVEEDNDGGEGNVTEEGEDIPEVQVAAVAYVYAYVEIDTGVSDRRETKRKEWMR